MAGNWQRSENEVLATLQDLVAIESINPLFPGGQRGETAVLEYLSNFFADAGIPIETQDVLPGRSNIIATLQGADPERVLLFDCHMDVVAVEGMSIPPFEPHIRDGKLYGRGSCDTKAGGVAMIYAMKRLKDQGIVPPCTIKYAGVIDEESGLRGVRKLVEIISADAAVVSEPTELAIVSCHKGVARCRITVEGIAAHSAKPELGVNAIEKMAGIITALQQLSKTFSNDQHPMLGARTISVGLVEGGTQVNFVPDRCSIEVDRRVLPGETPEDTLAEIAEVLEQLKAADPELVVQMEPTTLTEAVETAESTKIIRCVQQVLRDIGLNDELRGVELGTDASGYQPAGIPSIVLGPGCMDQAHSPVEFVDCDEVLRAVEIYQAIMTEFK